MERVGRRPPGKLTWSVIRDIVTSWPVYLFSVTFAAQLLGVRIYNYFTIYLKDTGRFTVEQVNIIPTGGFGFQVFTTLIYAWLADGIGRQQNHVAMMAGWLLTYGQTGASALIMTMVNEILSFSTEQRLVVIGVIETFGFSMNAWVILFAYNSGEAPHFKIGYEMAAMFFAIEIVTLTAICPLITRELKKKPDGSHPQLPSSSITCRYQRDLTNRYGNAPKPVSRHMTTDKARGADNLGARLAWMEDLMSQGNLLPHGISLDQIATGTGLDEILNTNSPPPSATSAAVPVPSDTASDQGIADAMDDCDDDDQGAYTTPTPVEPGPNCNSVGSTRDNCHSVVTASRPEPQQTCATASHPTATALQSIGDLLHGQSPNSQRRSARAYVDAYFGDINRAYPFVDKERVLSTLSIMGDLIITSAPDYDVDAIILYLVMAIGCTTLQRTEAASDSVFTINYKDLIHRCMMQETTDTAQILLLLAIYSLFDPHGLPAAPIVDLLARQAVRLGLTRRHTANPGGHLLPAEEERAHRLLWSIYALDRAIAVSTGMPAALSSINLDVPLPCITVDEFASPQRAEFISNLQVARHIIQLRILEDRVLYEIHLRDHKSTASLTRENLTAASSSRQN
ncbi:hypothetical protein NM208_g16024 [Fusarium decemcellulare]|uniref:Uncharacterized protein n=1 Tax=Fusarium decemcellulare TaxID=57161 RepID=A0ACC1RBC6_9HYPO|nr:hypothetical protein NM208_g16024 [Fusarium decemcellulare]